MTEEVREVYPNFAQEVNKTIKLCNDMLDNAINRKEERDSLASLNLFAESLAVLKSLVDNPTPGPMFDINQHITRNAFSNLERILAQHYEIIIPDDWDAPGVAI